MNPGATSVNVTHCVRAKAKIVRCAKLSESSKERKEFPNLLEHRQIVTFGDVEEVDEIKGKNQHGQGKLTKKGIY